MEKISPLTEEIYRIHKIYVEGARFQLEGFESIKAYIEKQDNLFLAKSKENISLAKEKLQEWQNRIQKVFKKYNIIF